jgi:hypothetical protein
LFGLGGGLGLLLGLVSCECIPDRSAAGIVIYAMTWWTTEAPQTSHKKRNWQQLLTPRRLAPREPKETAASSLTLLRQPDRAAELVLRTATE